MIATLLLSIALQDAEAEKIARGLIDRLDNKTYRIYALDNIALMADRLTGAVLDDAIAAVEKTEKALDRGKERNEARYADLAIDALKKQKANPWKPKEERDIKPEEVTRAMERAVKHLLALQNQNGSWGDEHTAAAQTGIAIGALLACPKRDSEEVRGAAERGVRWLVQAVMSDDFNLSKSGVAKYKDGGTTSSKQFGFSAHFVSNCSHAVIGLLAAKALKIDAKEAIERCLAALKETQLKEGNWPKYSTDQPKANFVVAEAMQALGAAKDAGFEVDAAVIAAAVLWMEADAKRDFPYLGGAISRRVSCELGLVACGADRPKKLDEALEKFFAERAILERIRLRRSSHQNDFGALSTTAYMYGYWHTARAMTRLGAKEKWAAKLAKTFVNTQEEDGGWKCGPQPEGTGAYNTAVGLRVLSEALP